MPLETAPLWSRADWKFKLPSGRLDQPHDTCNTPLEETHRKAELSPLLLYAFWTFHTKYPSTNCKAALGFARTCKEQLSAKTAACVITQHNTLHCYHFARCAASRCPICEGAFWLSLALLWQLLSLHHWCKTKEISERGSSFVLLQQRDMPGFSAKK